MVVLTAITNLKHREVFDHINLIIDTVKKGSAITIACGTVILLKLNTNNEYFNTTNPLFIEQLRKCPIKQLYM